MIYARGRADTYVEGALEANHRGVVSVCEPISNKGRRRAPMVPTSDLEESSLLCLYTILVPSTYLFAISRRPSRRIHLVNSQYADLKTRKW